MKYYGGETGDTFAGAALHTRADCDALDGQARPISDDTIAALDDGVVDDCPECGPKGESERDSDSDDKAGICTVELSSGGTCGRDRPCPYHD